MPARRLPLGLVAALLILAVVFTGAAAAGHGKSRSPYRGQGMWIWYVSKSSGGKLSRIAKKAKRHGVRTLYIKSADGTNSWDQFKRPMVHYFHRHGIRVCAWQYVYGGHPRSRRGGAPRQ